MTRHTVLVGLSVLLLAITARVALHFELRDYVLYRVPLVDAEDYVEWAARAARGEPEVDDVYYKAPLYPWVLSLGMRVLGVAVDTAYVVNALLGLLGVVLVGVWTRRVFGPRAGVGAAALAAVYGPMLYFEAQALPPPLAIVLSLGVLLAVTSGAVLPSWRATVLAGVCTGLLILTRPSFAVWLPVAAVWLAWRTRARAWRRALVLVLACFAVVAPVTLRNAVRGGTFVPVSANGGINFYLGNNAEAARTSALRPGLEWEELVRRVPDAERAGRARWDRWFARQAWSWVRDEPIAFLSGLATKTLQYLNTHEIDRNLDVRGFRAHSFALRAAPRYAWLAPWLLVGVVAAWRRGGAGRLAVGLMLASTAATVLFFVSERYRLDALAVTLPLGVAGFAATVSSLRGHTGALPRRAALALVVTSALLAFPNWAGIRTLQPAHATSLEGVATYAEGRNVEAIVLLRRAVLQQPDDADAHYQLATALRRQNRFDEALDAFETAARLVPGNPKPHAGAGLVLRQLGRPRDALERYERALREDPRNALLLFETAELYEELGQPGEAAARYRSVLDTGADAALVAEVQRRLQRLR